MANIPLPLFLNFKEWTKYLRLNATNINVPIAEHKDWREWANYVIQTNPNLQNIPLPTTLSYPTDEHWREWANYFYNIVQQHK